VSAAVDAPAIRYERLTEHQRQGHSCCWCAGHPDRRYPVRLLQSAGARLFACGICASMYGIPVGGVR
jgi:hypothetical protein